MCSLAKVEFENVNFEQSEYVIYVVNGNYKSLQEMFTDQNLLTDMDGIHMKSALLLAEEAAAADAEHQTGSQGLGADTFEQDIFGKPCAKAGQDALQRVDFTLWGTGASVRFDDAARKSFAELYKTAEEITETLDELRDDIDNGTVKIDEPENLFGEAGNSLLSTAMLEMESGLGELPELDYDGRYTKTAAEECADPITEDEARTIAADFLGLEGDEISLQYRSESGATSFEYKDKSLLVDGWGNVVSMSSSRVVTGDMPAKDMKNAARNFLKKHGIKNMHLVSSERIGGTQSMRFERLDGGVRIEADSVKISVAADTGEVYSFDASAHYAAAQKHAKPESIVTQTQAASALPKELSAKPRGMVYAETAGGSERLCYEFECADETGEKLHVLVDASTGEQYRISFI